MKILIVEDEQYIRQGIVEVLQGEGFEVRQAESVTQAFTKVSEDKFDAILCDNFLPDGEGLDLLTSVQTSDIAFILMTSFGNRELASRAFEAGAYDYIAKPIRFDELLARLERLQEKLVLRHKLKESEAAVLHQGELAVLGTSPAMLAVQTLIEKSSASQVPVILQGETGVGKGVVARLLHSMSALKDQPFIRINCAAIPPDLLESELFGHKKGAFSGAERDRKGLLASAGKGTLFLDELIELPLPMQSKLLHVLDEKSFRPVGGDKETPFAARVIAASNMDFEKAVQAGSFREDLYFRLNVMKIRIPPLRERGDDILPLANRLLAQICKEWSRSTPEITTEQAMWLEGQTWQGNVRELRNVLERGLLLGSDESLYFEALKGVGTSEDLDLNDACHAFEKRYIERVVEKFDGDKASAAEQLGIGLSTLYRKLEG